MANRGHKLIAAGTTILIAEPVLTAAAHQGGFGAIVGVGLGLIAYNVVEDLEKLIGRAAPTLPTLSLPKHKTGELPMWYRALNGASTRTEADVEPTKEDIAKELRRIGMDEAEITNWMNDLSGNTFGEQDTSGIFLFSELLATGWRPSWDEIFVGRTMQGKNIFVPALDLCHVAFAGKTGGGKGSLMRLIMVQLCHIGAPVALLNPHYMRWVVAKEGPDFDEDWSPFEGTNPHTNKPYLENSPIVCSEMATIDSCLTWAVETLLESRKQRARTQKVNFVPYFIVIDEWPLIVKKLGKKQASALLGYLLREGRKYRIYVIIASQGFQVETMGCEGEGSVRKCLLTVFYTGGDLTTRRELLNEVTRETPENKIGKGVILMRCTGTENEVILAHVPFVDNEAVYTLLGPSTYVDDGEPHEDEFSGIPEVESGPTSPQNGQNLTSRTPDTGYGMPEADDDEEASEEVGSAENLPEMVPPPGWTEERTEAYIEIFKINHHIDNSLLAMGFVQKKENRDYARFLLTKLGLIKPKRRRA